MSDAEHSAQTAFVVLGRGGVGAGAQRDLTAIAQAVQRQRPDVLVRHAFVDRQSPDLPSTLDQLLQVPDIRVVPCFLPDEPALRRWLDKVAMRWLTHRNYAGQLRVSPPLSGADALAAAVMQCADAKQPDIRDATAGDAWQTDPKAWSSVPAHQHHVLWCTGPRCAAKGALTLWPSLARTVQDDAELKKRVMLLQTSCQYPCNQGPMMIVYPEGRWYGPLDNGAQIATTLRTHVLQAPLDAAPCFHPDGSDTLNR